MIFSNVFTDCSCFFIYIAWAFYILLKNTGRDFTFYEKTKTKHPFFLLIAFFAVNIPMAYIGQNNIVEITEYEIKKQ